LFKKYNNLFEYKKLRKYNVSELIKLNKIISNNKTRLETIIKVFDKFNSINITEHNFDKLLLYLRDIDKFSNMKVGWGPGNQGDTTSNLHQHFNKHVLSNEESKYWSSILNNLDYKSYKNYAINFFNKMNKVIIHTDGVNIHLSGFYNNIFIIGRYHDDVFGISSCYYVNNGEKLGRYKGLCLKL